MESVQVVLFELNMIFLNFFGLVRAWMYRYGYIYVLLSVVCIDYELCVFAWEEYVCMFEVYMLKNVGERTLPCRTAVLKWLLCF